MVESVDHRGEKKAKVDRSAFLLVQPQDVDLVTLEFKRILRRQERYQAPHTM